MAGTIPLSMTQQFDIFGKPLAGAQLFIIQAGTVSTPQNAFQDVNLTIPMPNPITLDAAGRVPQFFLADGFIKIRLQDISGVVQVAADMILVIGPSSGGGGGSSVDPTALIQTGNMIMRYGVGVLTGYVRLNNLTIGSATSGATERANADAQALFNYLWGVDPTLVVVGGRGITAAADWTANKQLTLPDWRGYLVGALDDMGNSAAGRLTSAFFGTAATVLGAAGGAQSQTLSLAQLPTGIKAAGSGTASVTSTLQTVLSPSITNWANGNGITLTAFNPGGATAGILASTGSASVNTTSNNTSGAAHTIVQPTKLATIYMKL